MTQPNQDLLAQVYKHPQIGPSDLSKIFSAHHRVEISKGSVILESGKHARSYIILEEGLLRSFAHDYKGDDITTDFFTPGQIAIEVLSLFQKIPSQENIQALCDCIGWEIYIQDFEHLFQTIPGLPEWGRSWMTGRLFHFKQRTIEIATLSTKQRYLQLLHQQPLILRHTPLKHVASYLGVTDTSLSRIRKEVSFL